MTSRASFSAAVAAMVLLAAACAPTTGSTANAPLQVGSGDLTVGRGSTIYVRVDYLLTDFGLNPDALRASLWVPSGYDSEVGDVTSQFGLVDLRVAEGWGFRLQQMRAERRSVRGSGAFDAGRTEYSLYAVFRVDAAADAIPGPYRLRGTVNARGGGSQNVTLEVEALP